MGRKLHAGYSISLRFYLEWSVIWGRKKCVPSYYNGYMTGEDGFLLGLGSGSSDHHGNAVAMARVCVKRF